MNALVVMCLLDMSAIAYAGSAIVAKDITQGVPLAAAGTGM